MGWQQALRVGPQQGRLVWLGGHVLGIERCQPACHEAPASWGQQRDASAQAQRGREAHQQLGPYVMQQAQLGSRLDAELRPRGGSPRGLLVKLAVAQRLPALGPLVVRRAIRSVVAWRPTRSWKKS